MERSEHEGFDDPEATDDESSEDFAAEVENDPAHNPPDDLEDVKGG